MKRKTSASPVSSTTTGAARPAGNISDATFEQAIHNIQRRFLLNVSNGVPLFTTDLDPDRIWEAYLSGFATSAERQHHTCNECRRFIQKYGTLVTIDETHGTTRPAVWDAADAPILFSDSIGRMARLVSNATVTGVYLTKDTTWGMPKTGVWKHFYVRPPSANLYDGKLLTEFQAMAAKKEDWKTMERALSEYKQAYVEQAVALLNSDALYRADNVKGPAEFLLKMYQARNGLTSNDRDNILWLGVAKAPAGFCHPRTSMIGTLLDDIASGMNFDEVSRRFRDKMSPVKYQRPTAAPKAGNIAQAEKIVETLGIQRSFARRYARLNEIQTIWTPRDADPVAPRTGMFKNIKARNEPPAVAGMKIPNQTMTWVKFERDFMQAAEKIEIFAPMAGNYCALVTAVDADAPPIVQWDTEELRNPVSWYLYHTGSTAAKWQLRGDRWHPVNALTIKPCNWNNRPKSQHGQGVIFIIDGCKDTNAQGVCLFPEIMKADLKSISHVVEAYSKQHKLTGEYAQSASGLMFGDEKSPVKIRITSGGITTEITIDRWE